MGNTKDKLEQEANKRYPLSNCRGWIQDVDLQNEAFIAGANWQKEQSPWISVKDRLPKPEQEVLLYNSNSIRHYVVGWLRENKGYNKSIWSLNNGYVEDEDITHWMPIVEPK